MVCQMTGVQILVSFVGCVVAAWLGCWWFRSNEIMSLLVSFLVMPGLCCFLRVPHTYMAVVTVKTSHVHALNLTHNLRCESASMAVIILDHFIMRPGHIATCLDML